jgi:hypothetical protein
MNAPTYAPGADEKSLPVKSASEEPPRWLGVRDEQRPHVCTACH